jgi:hypothetical protein
LTVEMMTSCVRFLSLSARFRSSAPTASLDSVKLTNLSRYAFMLVGHSRGAWKDASFKKYNFAAAGVPTDGGALHPLLKVREEFRNIFFEMGCVFLPSPQSSTIWPPIGRVGVVRWDETANKTRSLSSVNPDSPRCRRTSSSSQLSGTSMRCSSLNNIRRERCKIPSTSRVRFNSLSILSGTFRGSSSDPIHLIGIPSQTRRPLALPLLITTLASPPCMSSAVLVLSVTEPPSLSPNRNDFSSERTRLPSRLRCSTTSPTSPEGSSRRRCSRLTESSGTRRRMQPIWQSSIRSRE